MKKIDNEKGFALIETLIVATFVLTIFVLLISNYYPMAGKLQRYSNYDEIDNTYIAYHTISLIQKNSHILDTPLELLTDEKINELKIPSCIKNSSNKCILIEFNKDICNSFEFNKEQCSKFIEFSGINKIFLTNYSLKPLKDNIDSISVSRAFELYLKYLPTHKNSANKIEDGMTKEKALDRIIIEIKLHDDKTNKDIYKYANYEIKIKGA